MTNELSKFRYYRLEGAALEVLKAYRDELDKLLADRQKLEIEYHERAKQQTDYHLANLRSMWQRMAASVGLDPDSTWGTAEYQIEARYVDEGFGALLYTPQQRDLLQDMFTGGTVADPQDPETDAPPKGTTRH